MMERDYVSLFMIIFMPFYIMYINYISELSDEKHRADLQRKELEDPDAYCAESEQLYLSFKKNKNQTIKSYWKENAISLYFAEQMVKQRIQPFLTKSRL